MGERNLTVLLRSMEPELQPMPYGFALWHGDVLQVAPFATVAETEGLTVIADLAEMKALGMQSDPWARISLTIHSDLSAVGLTAAFATALANAGISANVVAGLYHDHIFVPWDRRDDAMAALRQLAVA